VQGQANNQTMNNIQELEEELIVRIERMRFIISGLEGYKPFEEVLEMFRETRKNIDENWHLLNDITKLNELRMTKMAVNTLIEYIPNLKNDLNRYQEELIKLQNPDEIINKDYDPN